MQTSQFRQQKLQQFDIRQNVYNNTWKTDLMGAMCANPLCEHLTPSFPPSCVLVRAGRRSHFHRRNAYSKPQHHAAQMTCLGNSTSTCCTVANGGYLLCRVLLLDVLVSRSSHHAISNELTCCGHAILQSAFLSGSVAQIRGPERARAATLNIS